MAAVKKKATHKQHSRLLGGDTFHITLDYASVAAHCPAHKSLQNGKWVRYLG